MKVKDLARKMADHGTHPKVEITRCGKDGYVTGFVWQGHPSKISDAVGDMEVNRFIVWGLGYIEIIVE